MNLIKTWLAMIFTACLFIAPAVANARDHVPNAPVAECKNDVLAKAGINEEKARHLPVGWSYKIDSLVYTITKENPNIWSGCRDSILLANPPAVSITGATSPSETVMAPLNLSKPSAALAPVVAKPVTNAAKTPVAPPAKLPETKPAPAAQSDGVVFLQSLQQQAQETAPAATTTPVEKTPAVKAASVKLPTTKIAPPQKPTLIEAASAWTAGAARDSVLWAVHGVASVWHGLLSDLSWSIQHWMYTIVGTLFSMGILILGAWFYYSFIHKDAEISEPAAPVAERFADEGDAWPIHEDDEEHVLRSPYSDPDDLTVDQTYIH